MPAVETDDTRVEAMRIEVVVKQELANPGTTAPPSSKQERTAFSAAVATAFPQATQQPPP
jgi:hypothetical protein